jgi:uncharacterized protein YceK
MTRPFLILVMVTQLGCASIFWQTIGGTIIGNVAAEVIKDKLGKDAGADAKHPEK